MEPEVVVPPWRWRLARVLVGARLPEPYRPWVARQLRPYDDLRFRAVKCSTLFLLALSTAVALLGPELGRRLWPQLVGAPLGLTIGLLWVARDPGRRDLPYRMSGVRRDGTIDPDPPRNVGPWLTCGVVALGAVVLAAGVAATGGPTAFAEALGDARAGDRCRSVPADAARRLTDAAVPGSTLTGLRRVRLHGVTYVAARTSVEPLPVLPGIEVPRSGVAVWSLLPDGFGVFGGQPQGRNQAAAAATPELGLSGVGGRGTEHVPSDLVKAAGCAGDEPVVQVPPVVPDVAPGRIRLRGSVDLDQAADAGFCASSASVTIGTPPDLVTILATPPVALVTTRTGTAEARAQITGGRLRISGELREPRRVRVAGPGGTPPVGSIEADLPCRVR